MKKSRFNHNKPTVISTVLLCLLLAAAMAPFYIIFVGACGLIIVQVIPYFFNGVFGANVSFGGTSLIIIVGVVLETIKKIESQMLVRNYTGFLNNKR